MLSLWTGKPGASKTLNVLFELENEQAALVKAGKPRRPIFYTGIPNLTLDGWTEFADPTKWRELPANSILVVDEAQNYFPVRRKDDAPEFVTALSTHRHHGLDIVLITQDPMLVDVWVRRLVNRHCHVVRPMGATVSNIFEWQQVTDINDPGARKQALFRARPFPKKFYAVYKSADAHTHSVRVPWVKVGLVGGAAVLLIVVVVWGVANISTWGKSDEVIASANRAVAAAESAAGAANAAAAAATSAVSQMAQAFVPRVEGLPWSAPFYDSMVQARDMPYVAGCALIEVSGQRARCTCADQQGNTVPMSALQCRQFLRDGVFDWSGKRLADEEAQIAALEARQSAGGAPAASGGARAPIGASGAGGAPAPDIGLGFGLGGAE